MSNRGFYIADKPLASAIKYLILLCLSALVLTSCASKKADLSKLSEQKLYETAQNHLKSKRYILATETLQQLESDHPFGKYAQSSQLALIYAYYKSNELPLAISAANRFIRLHPNHPNVDYAYYMRGLANFPKAGTLFQSAFGTDLSNREAKSAQTSFIHFADLVDRFPASQYQPDATKRMQYLRNLIARHEMNVANYYLRREAFLAAANRGRYIVENFQRTPSVPDALAIMVYSYHQLGMKDLSQDSLSVLTANYPDYPALSDSGEFDFDYPTRRSRSIFSALTFNLIDLSPPDGFDTRKRYGQ